jgi:hypothetical protein
LKLLLLGFRFVKSVVMTLREFKEDFLGFSKIVKALILQVRSLPRGERLLIQEIHDRETGCRNDYIEKGNVK